MERAAMKSLVEWKDRPRRKPMLITGCRPCGKAWLMMEPGRLHFEKTLIFIATSWGPEEGMESCSQRLDRRCLFSYNDN